jgi:hypothetical protein
MSQSYTISAIPGISIYHAAKNAVGTGTLDYVASAGRLNWTPHGGNTYTISIGESGNYIVGDVVQGYLRIVAVVPSLPVTDTSCQIAIDNLDNTLFAPPTQDDYLSGATDYRALYLHNQSSSKVGDVSLLVLQGQYGSDIRIGSMFSSVSQYATSMKERLGFRTYNPITNTPAFSLSMEALYPRESLVSISRPGYPRFGYYPSIPTQYSDGVNYGVEHLIADIYDSGGVLANVEWGSRLYWKEIDAGKMVSFWVRRDIKEKPYIPATETMQLDISFTQL